MKKDEEIKKLKEKIEELTNNWKRALADYQNLEKRIAAEKENFISFANAKLILKLLGVLDILEKAQEILKDKGLDLAIQEFRKILYQEGLREIEALNKDFNPQLMECVEVVKSDEEGKVKEVVFKGYELNGKLLRPVKVKVGKREIDKKAKDLAKEEVTSKGNYM